MNLQRIANWLDATLKVADFDDVSNNGLQLERAGRAVATVAFAVDASLRAVEAAAESGAGLLVVHHGLSWGGGIRRVTGGVGRVLRAAIERDVAIYACHLPLDAHPVLGNNAQLAKRLGLRRVRPAFSYHGNVIGLVGVMDRPERLGALVPSARRFGSGGPLTVGVCSGGAGEFAEEAKDLGCDLYLTGEASWGEVIAAENCGMEMVVAGHYATEVWGVRAVAAAMKRALKVRTVDLTDVLRPAGA